MGFPHHDRGQSEMPDKRAHRGPDPRDSEAFGPSAWPALCGAVADLSWLLGQGYAPVSALKLVGDRWSLTERQRQAVRRSACSDDARDRRAARQVAPVSIAGKKLVIDGFNVLTTIEAALGGAIVIVCRDTTCRDIAGIHGSYRKVAETLPALERLATVLENLGIHRSPWLFDRPVSNSGRIRSVVLELAGSQAEDWSVELVDDPDPILGGSSEIVATADSVILDNGPPWLNLARIVIESTCSEAVVVDLSC
jgi:hypothetical protein